MERGAIMAVQSTAKPNGLKTVWDTIIAPIEAFDAIALAPMWAVAFLVAAIFVIASYYLERQATVHAALATYQHLFATNPAFSKLSDDRKTQILDGIAHPSALAQMTAPLVSAIVVLITALLNAAIMLMGSALGHGKATFKQLWAGSMNIAVPTLGLGALVLGIVTMLRGPDGFDNLGSITNALPNLGWIVHNPTLQAISVFTIWGCVLNGLMMRRVAQTSPAVSWSFAIAVLVLTAIAQSGASRLYGG
jgi:hypothetical protein